MTDESNGAPLGRRRSLDASALRALAHPLRIEIYETLGRVGTATASGLAEQLGESSGSTSYHLRQLERHGLVREVEGKGTGRERWWEVVPGGVSVSAREHDSAASRKSARMVIRQWDRSRAALLEEFAEAAESDDGIPREWYDASSMATINVSATVDELRTLSRAFHEFSATWIDPLRRPSRTDAEHRVQIHFNAFPIPEAFLPASGAGQPVESATVEPSQSEPAQSASSPSASSPSASSPSASSPSASSPSEGD